MSDIALAEYRKLRSVELRLAGHDYDFIARDLGYTNRGTAHRTVTKALNERKVASVDEYRQVAAASLDALQAAVWPQALLGDTKAVDCCLRVMAQRAKLLGFEAMPTQADVPTQNTIVIQGDTEEYIRRLKLVDGFADA